MQANVVSQPREEKGPVFQQAGPERAREQPARPIDGLESIDQAFSLDSFRHAPEKGQSPTDCGQEQPSAPEQWPQAKDPKTAEPQKLSFLMSKLNRWNEQVEISCSAHKRRVEAFCHREKSFLCAVCLLDHEAHRDQISTSAVIEKTIKDAETIHQQLREIRDFFDGQLFELEGIVRQKQIDSRSLEGYMMRSSALLSNPQLLNAIKQRSGSLVLKDLTKQMGNAKAPNIFSSNLNESLDSKEKGARRGEARTGASPRNKDLSLSQTYNNGVGLEIWQSGITNWPKKTLDNSMSTSFDIASTSAILKKRAQEIYVRSLFPKLPVTQLLFRASKNDFKAEAFHEKCDGKAPLLILFQSAEDKIFGAFSSKPFDKSGSFKESPHSFLFSISQNAKMEIYKNPGNAIFCNEFYGPTFGCGYDLFIPCSANKRECHSRLGYTYALPPKMKVNSEEANSFLAGSPKFLLKEFEVFLLNFDALE